MKKNIFKNNYDRSQSKNDRIKPLTAVYDRFATI